MLFTVLALVSAGLSLRIPSGYSERQLSSHASGPFYRGLLGLTWCCFALRHGAGAGSRRFWRRLRFVSVDSWLKLVALTISLLQRRSESRSPHARSRLSCSWWSAPPRAAKICLPLAYFWSSLSSPRAYASARTKLEHAQPPVVSTRRPRISSERTGRTSSRRRRAPCAYSRTCARSSPVTINTVVVRAIEAKNDFPVYVVILVVFGADAADHHILAQPSRAQQASVRHAHGDPHAEPRAAQPRSIPNFGSEAVANAPSRSASRSPSRRRRRRCRSACSGSASWLSARSRPSCPSSTTSASSRTPTASPRLGIITMTFGAFEEAAARRRRRDARAGEPGPRRLVRVRVRPETPARARGERRAAGRPMPLIPPAEQKRRWRRMSTASDMPAYRNRSLRARAG